ncbi:flagellar basal body-associated FliL family protein [Primorskyibacter sp. S187A]|uniref:flagellar basal body-associated FliL family protein n=1 Tax=Primorskyibacter sp. S187A TaxID=3415130 RepID=UPI003C79D639
MKKILPILLALIGIGGGVGAGLALRPDPAEMADAAEHCVPVEKAEDLAEVKEPEADLTKEYVELSNQFVVPLVAEDRVSGMVVVSLSVEVDAGTAEDVYSREPKLRDTFLQVLFDHANIGGFDGAFTSSNTLKVLRRALLEASTDAVGDMVSDVLITEIARQDA